MVFVILTHHIAAAVLSDVYLNLISRLLAARSHDIVFLSLRLNLLLKASTLDLSLVGHSRLADDSVGSDPLHVLLLLLRS